MSTSVWMRRIALTVASTALVGTQLLSPAIAAPVDPGPPGQSGLLAHVPPEIRSSCSDLTDQAATEGWMPAGAVEVQGCAVDSPTGATVVIYSAFRDEAALQAAFTAETPATPGQGTCDDGNPGQTTYTQGDSPDEVGQVTCFPHPDGGVEIAWTHEQSGILSVLVDPQLDLAQLTQIWTGLGPIAADGSDRQGSDRQGSDQQGTPA